MSVAAEETVLVPNSDPADLVPLLGDIQFDWRIQIADSTKERFRRMVLDVLRSQIFSSMPDIAVIRRQALLPDWDDLSVDIFDERGTRVCTLKTVKDVHGKIRLFA
jgi:hypothetical protein